ncbi:CDP-glucose 4,6-dehydratase [bacterium]|nr:CDP-glucose 4,6-dehydratase [bacterium]MBT3580769.1 CDP-glucose 4,6-dehydratase [bacterium]MBT4551620.1 CDP-glucose 4,6-dehydratase [bacterium]MBT7088423.1 CDP-glucose 4,6-dehydratase [bacterium]
MKSLFKDLYQNKKVLITGHTGFKGSWLTLWLKELGAEILGYSLSIPTKPSHFELLGLDIKTVFGDIRDAEKLKQTFQEFQPEIVFHLAAQPFVRASYKDPRYTYETNVMGTVNLFEAVRQTPSVKVVVNITTDKCYENREWVYGYRENDPMGGYDPYSNSKGCSELITASYRNSFFNAEDFGKTHNVSLASVRAGNVIGGGDWGEDRLIPDFARALSKSETLVLRNPQATRPWQHVLEPLSGYLKLGSLMYQNGAKYSSGWNFGPQDSHHLTVEEIVKQSLKIWGSGKYKVIPDKELHEAMLLKLDISKAQYYLNWQPVYDSAQTIEESIKWYKEYYSGHHNMRAYSIKQIEDYIDKRNVKEN